MQKVVVVYKANSAEALELARRLGDWLGRRGRGALLHEAQAEPAGHAPADPNLPPDCGLVVVLGGDGTMLGAVRETVRAGLAQAPILGVNLGGLGFLTALAPEELLPALEMVLDGHFSAPPRLMLEACVRRQGAPERRVVALNDVVINKAALARIVELTLSVDDKPLTVFRADGLIIATPTGSTAYNLSAGGPICHPSLDCIVVTPICSFALSNRPLLLGPQMTLSVELGQRAQDTTLTSDGQVGIQLLPGDRIDIRRAGPSVRLVQSPFKDYFEILRTKLRWG
ncbi:MAG: NAD(+)/NADH kinase [Pseudomonadota bacterium]